MHTDITFDLPPPPTDRALVSYVDIRLAASDMVNQWRRCSMTADFIAGFVYTAPVHEAPGRSALSMVIDELIENAVKFCADALTPVSITVHDYGDMIRLDVSNTCDEQHASELEKSIRRVLESDLEALFVAQIEETAAEDRLASRLGFITLCINHGARLGARITQGPRDGLYTATVQVLLDRQEALA